MARLITSRLGTLVAVLVTFCIAPTWEQTTRQSSPNSLDFNTFDLLGRKTDTNNILINEPSYFVVASRVLRPGQLYRIAATILNSQFPLSVRASILRNGVDIGSASQECRPGIPETLLIKVPPTSVPGQYRLRVEGNTDRALGGTAFLNETLLTFSQRSMTIFIQTEKPVYHQSQAVKLRIIPINTELRAFDDAIDVYMLDPRGFVVRRWLSRQSNFGAVSLEYALSDQPTFGKWTIRVLAQGQTEEESFHVEEYYQNRFEVNVSMPAFFFDKDEFIHGAVMANYTSGAPVVGNLTLKATIRPVRPNPRTRLREPVTERNLTFTEKFGGWFTPATRGGSEVLQYFRGTYDFQYPMADLERIAGVGKLDGMEIQITAMVGDRFLNEYYEGFSTARIFNTSLKLSFLGGTPQVFKPSMPFTCYLAVSFFDGSPLPLDRLRNSSVEIRSTVMRRSGGSRNINLKNATAVEGQPGVYEFSIDLRAEFASSRSGIATDKNRDSVNDVTELRLNAIYTEKRGLFGEVGETATGDLTVLTQYSPGDKHIHVQTSTRHPKVGEYIILHIRANYYVETFSYVVLAKGIILLAGQDLMSQTVHTLAITLSADMAPVATVVVYHVSRYGEVVADSLTFPVNGISRNNFTLSLNPMKDKTGDTVEVVILGEPGSYVGISAVDKSFYSMQAGNSLSYTEVLRKMAEFDEDTNGTLTHFWTTREGNPDEIVHFPSSTYGMDANQTFEFVNLVVFTDANVIRRQDNCNISFGLDTCMSGACYRVERRCDGVFDCTDKSDEAGCASTAARREIMDYRLHRINRLLRMYENSWLWKDINIGPHGHYIFSIPIPDIPTSWIVSAFSVSPKLGFGLTRTGQEFAAFKPFYMNVEMPSACRQGEQIGIRVTLFNYMTERLEALVVLANSPDYKFIHVDDVGEVKSYDPRTSHGEHQHLIHIPAQDSIVVYIPVVPTKLGEIFVTIQAKALVRKDQVTRRVYVEADGVPQYRHTSVMLDLSSRAWFFQYIYINVTQSPLISYVKDRYYVYGSNHAKVTVVGDVVGPAFASMPINATSALNLPMDCGEQNMFGFAMNLYTIKYMRLTTQRRRDTDRQAFHYMNIAYQRQLSFQSDEGYFSYFRSDWNNSEPSVWLTAFCVRIFTEANFNEWENYLYIDPAVISHAVGWLVRHQSPEGAFYEVSSYADRKMNGTTSWGPQDTIRFRNISLTAHVVIALTTVRDLPGELGSITATARTKAMGWLERNINLLERRGDPYEVAIVAYALTLAKSTSAEAAFGILFKHAREEGGFTYWGRTPVPLPESRMENQKPFLLPRLPHANDATNIETTAYALLTYVGRQEYNVDPIVRWLNTQRLTDSGWASTQDTIIAMQGLIEYTVRGRIRDVSSLTLHVEASSDPNLQKTFYINEGNLAQPQSFDIPNAWGHVKVQARGAGYAIMQLSLQYNVDVESFITEPPVPAFALKTNAFFFGRNSSHIRYTSCQRWTRTIESNRSGMAVLEVNIPTGYIIQQQVLDSYTLSNQVRNLKRARYTDKKVFFYFDYLDNRDTCVEFTIERWYPVANMTRFLPIRVYDYYAPERFKETIFDAFQMYVLNICQVCGSFQCPYCPTYNRTSPLHASSVLVLLVAALTAFWTRDLNL